MIIKIEKCEKCLFFHKGLFNRKCLLSKKIIKKNTMPIPKWCLLNNGTVFILQKVSD